VQEALSNVVKHARATKASVSVTTDGSELKICVVDDGRGFDPDAPASGFGLLGMRERIDLAGGRLAISSNAPGTRIDIALPARTRP
jgi:two-component system sensor histidine kinase UhpB